MTHEETIKNWDENLETLVADITQGNCHKSDIPRHCRHFLESYRKAIARQPEGIEERERIFNLFLKACAVSFLIGVFTVILLTIFI